MNGFHIHGKKPYSVVLVHGGPGAPGSLCSLARALSISCGVLEPFQTRDTISGLVDELERIMQKRASLPVAIIGHSWGAWLSMIFASLHHEMVFRLILVSSGPLKEEYVPEIEKKRLSRLLPGEEREYELAVRELVSEPCIASEKKDSALKRLARLTSKTDSFEPDACRFEYDGIKLNAEAHQRVWHEARELRRTGKLLEIASGIECPVYAIHGDYDPHPARGVRDPLSGVIKAFDFMLLDRCGHYPWKEKHAKASFMNILLRMIRDK